MAGVEDLRSRRPPAFAFRRHRLYGDDLVSIGVVTAGDRGGDLAVPQVDHVLEQQLDLAPASGRGGGGDSSAIEQQAIASLHRLRSTWLATRTARLNTLRGLLREFGVELPEDMEVRVWDSTAEVRYLVIPERPAGSDGLDEEALATMVTRDGMIGVARL